MFKFKMIAVVTDAFDNKEERLFANKLKVKNKIRLAALQVNPALIAISAAKTFNPKSRFDTRPY